MPTRLSAILLAGLTAATVAACDAAPPAPALPGDTPRQVTVVGEGDVQGTPDLMTASAGIAVLAADATDAMNQSNDRVNAVRTALVEAGIDEADIGTADFTLQPQYGPDGISTEPVGYQASNTMNVTIRDTGVAGRVLALIQSSGGNATRINSVAYSFADDSELVRDARTNAFEDAQARAQQYADLSGMQLGRIISISETGGGAPPPTPMPMERAMAASPVPLSPGQQTVSFSVTAVWELT
jgi:uncharacterized protein